MKFAHMADCHIGGWRDPKLKKISLEAFQRAVDICINKEVDFVLISGDLFNNSFPQIDLLKETVRKLKQLQEKNIPVYIIAGSHDFSPSGKTILDVLEEAGLCINVVQGKVEDKKLKLKFTIDRNTGAKITGMIGRRGMLERSYYEVLDKKHLESEPGFKIFMFHTALTELKPKNLERMDSAPISFLPKNFDYYAGGHVHIVEKASLHGYTNVVYPGPLFPNNFYELEELQRGGFYFYDNGETSYEPIQIYNVHSLKIDASHKLPEQLTDEIIALIKDREFNKTIVLLRIKGTLESGKTTDIDFRKITSLLYSKSAYFVMRNTNKLKSREFEEIKIKASTAEEIEESVIEEHLGQIPVKAWDLEEERKFTHQLMMLFSREKKEGEKVYEFEERIRKEAEELLRV
ncbi:DNA repair exonuclease [Candidatus Woesearchaeota archaeon]|nr:DNA repair exonuclease [Candidatus Woesearchaeota archaeon]